MVFQQPVYLWPKGAFSNKLPPRYFFELSQEILMKIIDTPVSFSDERGKITDMIENENINAVTLVTVKKGSVRGNHYHKKTIQWNYLISGKLRLVTQVSDKRIIETVIGKGVFFEIPPKERHAFVGLEDAQLVVFTRGPRGGKEYESDTFRLEPPLVGPNGRPIRRTNH